MVNRKFFFKTPAILSHKRIYLYLVEKRAPDRLGVQTQLGQFQTDLRNSLQKVDRGVDSPEDMASGGKRRLVAEPSYEPTQHREIEYH
jgi:hypothetical protein